VMVVDKKVIKWIVQGLLCLSRSNVDLLLKNQMEFHMGFLFQFQWNPDNSFDL
jgi:hypothetical protein